MCELLICADSKINEDSIYLDTKLPKRGDVISVREDNCLWGDMELHDSQWRIVKAPNLSVEEGSILLSPEPPSYPDQVYGPNTLQYRGYYVSEERVVVDPEFAAYLSDSSRKEPFYVVPDNIKLNDVLAQRTPIPDPALIGNGTPIIG